MPKYYLQHYGFVGDDKSYLAHHGIEGMRWGKRNGPPYPLSDAKHDKVVEKSKPKHDREYRKAVKKSNRKFIIDTLFRKKKVEPSEELKKLADYQKKQREQGKFTIKVDNLSKPVKIEIEDPGEFTEQELAKMPSYIKSFVNKSTPKFTKYCVDKAWLWDTDKYQHYTKAQREKHTSDILKNSEWNVYPWKYNGESRLSAEVIEEAYKKGDWDETFFADHSLMAAADIIDGKVKIYDVHI